MAKKEIILILVLLLSALSWGCIDSPGDGVKVITVGATDKDNHIADFSGSGPTRDGRTKPTIVGPGVDVVSTAPPGLEKPDYINVYYAKAKGTSVSTPVAAGVAALMFQADPSLTPAGVKAAITRGAHKLNNTQGEEYEEYYQGAGLLDANKSYSMISDDLCGVEPDKWIVGKWAFLSGGKAISPGLDTGADRAQKKLYALAPSDQDWTTKFVFFTNRAREEINMSVTGPISPWTILQPLPRSLPANSQNVFGATLTVPNGTSPGIYAGAIEITEKNRTIFSLPVSVEVARSLDITNGIGDKSGIIGENQWQYYYLDVPLGTSEIKASISWKNSSELNLFMLAPTSEYYGGVQTSQDDSIDITTPSSGRWLMAIHARNVTDLEKYTLSLERSGLESAPKNWMAGPMQPGQIKTAEFMLQNRGPALNNLSYQGVVDNTTFSNYTGSVADEKSWDQYLDVPGDAKYLMATATWDQRSSDLALRIYSPDGNLAQSSDGYESQEVVDVTDPVPGKWRIEVYGYSVPMGREQSFALDVVQYSKRNWSWISVQGPKDLESGANGTLNAVLSVPAAADGRGLQGHIEIASGNESFDLPVSMTVAGATIKDISYAEGRDNSSRGYNRLSIGVDVNVSLPGDYRLEGGLEDCSGEMIRWLTNNESLSQSNVMALDVSGSDLWKSGKCGPMKIDGLFLYNGFGELIDQYKGNTTINLSPKDFHPPEAYFSGNFTDLTGSDNKLKRIRIGVGVTVVQPGTYQLSGRLEDDSGNDLGRDTVMSGLSQGEQTVQMEFNPTKFTMLGQNSSIHLKDLSLDLNGTELERRDNAWTSDVINPDVFKDSSSIRAENGKIVIP
ncbi:MAG TPA: S8 family serine peptidase [Methanotrichaceae archaeon]|nr:S8 family serine peptidase [Methanotrichaceae archaeon]